MNYIGEKSLSSIVYGVLKVSWFLAIAGAMGIALIMSIILYVTPVEDAQVVGLAKANYLFFQEVQSDPEIVTLQNLPLVVKLLLPPYFIGVMFLVLSIIKKSQKLFYNLKANIVFCDSNVVTLKGISKYMIMLSLLTFGVSSLLLGLILLIGCEVFKNGTELQHEHDLTI